jgi:GNAT superfamily N-acetyltransferase
VTITPLDVAEDAFAYTPDPPTQERVEFDGYVLRNHANPHPMFGLVLRPRLRDDRVDAALEHARGWFRERGRARYTWLVGDSATPSRLVDRLRRRGLAADEDEPVYAGMILDREPPQVPAIEVRRVADLDEFVRMNELMWEAFGSMPPDADGARERLREIWAHHDDRSVPYAAFAGGELVGSGSVLFTAGGAYLVLGNVAPHARGSGVYRALVRARWDEAVRRGVPVLVVQAGKMSKPILERLGFRQVRTIHALVDRTDE